MQFADIRPAVAVEIVLTEPTDPGAVTVSKLFCPLVMNRVGQARYRPAAPVN